MSRPNNAYVWYHDNCVDGFGAAWAFNSLAKDAFDGVDYTAVQYGNPVPHISGVPDERATLFILDFSYPRTILSALAKDFDKIVILDHHKTAREELDNWTDKPANVYIEFDMSRSGAMMTWDYLVREGYANKLRMKPALLSYIQDRDLWQHQVYKTKEINALIAFTLKEFDRYTELARKLDSTEFHSCITMGHILLESHQRHVDSIVKACKRKIFIEGKEGLVCNCPGQFASDVGHELTKLSGTYGATYYHASDDSVKFSLRSEGDYDVSAIAKLFGGGGHKNAAGFSLESPSAVDPINQHTGVILWANQLPQENSH